MDPQNKSSWNHQNYRPGLDQDIIFMLVMMKTLKTQANGCRCASHMRNVPGSFGRLARLNQPAKSPGEEEMTLTQQPLYRISLIVAYHGSLKRAYIAPSYLAVLFKEMNHLPTNHPFFEGANLRFSFQGGFHFQVFGTSESFGSETW